MAGGYAISGRGPLWAYSFLAVLALAYATHIEQSSHDEPGELFRYKDFAGLFATQRRNTAAAGLRALLDQEPGDRARFAQLGAVNAWSSVGAETLWREGEPYSPHTVDAVLDRRPDLALTCAHPVAVEFGPANQDARPGWLAFYVAPPGGRVDRERLHEILARVTGDPTHP